MLEKGWKRNGSLLSNDYFVLNSFFSPGVYFDCCVRQIKFVDFCGKYRLPLMHYLCSPECSSPCSSASHSSTSQSESDSEDEASVAAHRMQKVLLGWIECRVVWNTKRTEQKWLEKKIDFEVYWKPYLHLECLWKSRRWQKRFWISSSYSAGMSPVPCLDSVNIIHSEWQFQI